MVALDGSFTVISRGSLILLVHHAYPDKKGVKHWSFPGGGRESGESFRTAALRECTEETGCTPRIITKIAEYQSRKYEGQTTFLYHGFLETESQLNPENKNEIDDVQFVSKNEAQKLLILPAQCIFLATFQSYLDCLSKQNGEWNPYLEYMSKPLTHKEIEHYLQSPVVV